ncbi:MAG: hypothetical protein HY708_04790 [Ignavibacteriae bacterium]|nr:hypothetical protein [Ignavibacteriota bacterium]
MRKTIRYTPGNESVASVKDAEITYDAKGRKKSVIIPYKVFEEMVRIVEDYRDNKLMDEVKKEPDIPWSIARRKLKRK